MRPGAGGGRQGAMVAPLLPVLPLAPASLLSVFDQAGRSLPPPPTFSYRQRRGGAGAESQYGMSPAAPPPPTIPTNPPNPGHVPPTPGAHPLKLSPLKAVQTRTYRIPRACAPPQGTPPTRRCAATPQHPSPGDGGPPLYADGPSQPTHLADLPSRRYTHFLWQWAWYRTAKSEVPPRPRPAAAVMTRRTLV